MIELPVVILARVCSFLKLKDLKAISLLNRAFYELFEKQQDIWNCLLRERYHYVISDASQRPFRARSIFAMFDNGLRYRADFDGAHTNNRSYWTRDRPCADSVYGTVMYLKHVWWLEGGIRVNNIPPGRYAVIWRVQARIGHYDIGLSMFHTVVPHRAATLLGLNDTRQLIDLRGGDGWIQKVVGRPTPEEKLETPRYCHNFYNRSDGTIWQLGEWSYLVFPASLIVTETSDIYLGTYDVTSSSHHSIAYDWVQLLPLKRDDGAITQSDAFRALMKEEAAHCGVDQQQQQQKGGSASPSQPGQDPIEAYDEMYDHDTYESDYEGEEED